MSRCPMCGAGVDARFDLCAVCRTRIVRDRSGVVVRGYRAGQVVFMRRPNSATDHVSAARAQTGRTTALRQTSLR